MLLNILVYIFAIAFFFYVLFIIEQAYTVFFRRQVPFVPSNGKLRKLVIREIKNNYQNAKLICEVGSGFGGFARSVARNTNAKVFALENMPYKVLFSKILDWLSGCNNKTIWCDAYKYLGDTKQKFDIAVAYLTPADVTRLLKYKNKIKVLISLDFEIDNMQPNKIISGAYGYTYLNGKKYPHKAYVYEFDK